MEIEKICRCCLALSGPLLSIYDGGSAGGGCVADMLKEIAKLKPQPNDNMPEKVCLQCISEINRCFMFKIKCENSNKTLRQLLPAAVKELVEDVPKQKVTLTSSAVQTEEKIMISSLVQTMEKEKSKIRHKEIQTMEEEKPLVTHREVQTEYVIENETTLSNETNLEKFIEHTVSEDLIYEQIESSLRKRKNIQISPTTRQLSSPMKKICFEENVHETLTSVEEPVQQEAYILLEDSNMGSNCSNEQELYMQSSEENQQDHESVDPNSRQGYYENEVEEISDNDQQSIVYTDNQFVYNDDVQNEEEYQIASSEIVQKLPQESKSSLKKKKLYKRKGQFKCSQCIMTFFSIKVLIRHLANRHNIKNSEFIIEDFPYEPEETEEDEPSSNINYAESSAVELTVDNVPNPQLCPRERVTTIVNEEMLTNIKYFCDYCQAGFAQHKSLNFHKKNNICMTNNFKCKKCERIFVSQENLDAHLLTYNHDHKCLECHAIFKTIEDLSQHMIEEHHRYARNQCHVCKKVFTMKTSLMDHLRIHSGEKPFLCTVCGKSFRQNSNLRQHLMRHNNAKKFKCDICPDAFVTKAELCSHQRTHTGDHPFKCDECSATFTTSCSLQKHKRKHTGERPYACEFCPLRFAALNVLKNHRRTHTGEKPFKCSYCEKSFTQKGDCLMHQKTHIDKCFKCCCGSKFTKKCNLKYHIKKQHPDLTEKQMNALIEKTENKNDTEQQVTLLEDGENDLEAVEEETSEFVTISNEDDEGDIIVSLNNSKPPNNNNVELIHIVLEDVV